MEIELGEKVLDLTTTKYIDTTSLDKISEMNLRIWPVKMRN